MTHIAVITGGREYMPTPNDLALLHEVLTDRDIAVVRCGGARGVDTAVYEHVRDVFARELWPADWGRFADLAGPYRNAAMLTGDTTRAHVSTETDTAGRGARLCVAFRGGRGTANCIRTAKKHAIDVWVIGEGRW